MKKALTVIFLYVTAAIRWWLRLQHGKPQGIHGSSVFMFFDPDHPERLHGVVAFLLPPNEAVENFSEDLFGPFGYSSQTKLRGLRLYARDTWGTVTKSQINLNPELTKLWLANPQHTILLAGVRHLRGYHPYPLNDPQGFILVRKR